MRPASAVLLFLLLTAPLQAQRSAAPAAPTAPAAAASGTDTITIDSSILGRARRVFVSLPASHAQTTRTYPVILVLDGEASFAPATSIATTLANLGHFPEAVVVGIPNATSDWNDRVHDMTPPGLSVSGSSLNEGGDRFLDFLEKELLPALSTRYRGGAPAMLVGHSSGGVIATWAAATRPSLFPVVISIDAPIHLGDDWLAERMMERARGGDSAPLRYVSLETRFGWPDAAWSALKDVAPSTWHLHREELAGESHESMVFLALYQGLKHAFSDYSIVGAPLVPRASARSAFDHYARLGSALGAELPPPRRVLRQMIEDLLIEGRVDEARRARDWLVDGYGPLQDEATMNAEIARVAALLPLPHTVESLKAEPFPTPSELAAYIGEWRGEGWLNPVAKSPIGLRIRVVDGRVVAEALQWIEGSERARPVEYLKLTADGLDYGTMNGMRPLGMLIYSGRRSGNVLEGEMNFGGIVLPLPGGFNPPPSYFRLEKM